MLEKRFGYFHGWVEGIQTCSTAEGCLLKVRLADGQVILMTAFRASWLLKSGNEISVAVKNSHPSHAVALIDHTAGNGEILPRPARQLPDREDALIATTMLGLTLFLSGWRALPVFAVLMLVYGLARHWLPEVIRRRDMTRIAHLIDCDYHHWRQAHDGQKSVIGA